MSMKDQLTDMLCRINNGQQRGLRCVDLHRSTSTLCLQLLRILQREGYINGCEKNSRTVRVYLKYTPLGNPVISTVRRISKPSNRIYVNMTSLWQLNKGLGVFILSTPRGLMTDLDAKIINHGGEVLCSII